MIDVARRTGRFPSRSQEPQISFVYDGLEFDTGLQAHWAAFFDLAGWHGGRTVRRSATGSLTSRSDSIAATLNAPATTRCWCQSCQWVRPKRFKDIPALTISDVPRTAKGKYVADAGGAFGTSPPVSTWQMAHGFGGGLEDVSSWVGTLESGCRTASVVPVQEWLSKQHVWSFAPAAPILAVDFRPSCDIHVVRRSVTLANPRSAGHVSPPRRIESADIT